jgi:hypothetical protein
VAVPRKVVCLISALAYDDPTTQVPNHRSRTASAPDLGASVRQHLLNQASSVPAVSRTTAIFRDGAIFILIRAVAFRRSIADGMEGATLLTNDRHRSQRMSIYQGQTTVLAL